MSPRARTAATSAYVGATSVPSSATRCKGSAIAPINGLHYTSTSRREYQARHTARSGAGGGSDIERERKFGSTEAVRSSSRSSELSIEGRIPYVVVAFSAYATCYCCCPCREPCLECIARTKTCTEQGGTSSCFGSYDKTQKQGRYSHPKTRLGFCLVSPDAGNDS